jgi:hypothetical protein
VEHLFDQRLKNAVEYYGTISEKNWTKKFRFASKIYSRIIGTFKISRKLYFREKK